MIFSFSLIQMCLLRCKFFLPSSQTPLHTFAHTFVHSLLSAGFRVTGEQLVERGNVGDKRTVWSELPEIEVRVLFSAGLMVERSACDLIGEFSLPQASCSVSEPGN